MHSALYRGQLRHRRFAPRHHEFSYRLFMVYVDLAELDQVFARRWLWSVRRPALAWLRRGDFLGDPHRPLDQAVRDRVQQETGARPTGPIRMLTHLRYFGFSFNPVTFYYCFDRDDTHVETIVAEITNTPWKERHAYVLPRTASTLALSPTPALPTSSLQPPAARDRAPMRFQFNKTFHVSPFMEMNYQYDWRFSQPGDRLTVHMENIRDGNKAFDATLELKREEITGAALARALIAFPCMTATVLVGIYWQALKLWLKRIPFYTHPKHLPQSQS